MTARVGSGERDSNDLLSEKTARNLFLAVEHNTFPMVV
jgi:hypothetical protein